jgi:uncharacterized protein YyaL (SSP411 family)
VVAVLPIAVKYPGSFGIWSSLILQQVTAVNEIAVVGQGASVMAVGILSKYIPFRVIMVTAEDTGDFALLAGKPARGDAAAYLCKNYSCQAPASSAEKLYEQTVKKIKI